MALKTVIVDGIEYTQETLQKNVDGNVPYMDKVYGNNIPKVNYNANVPFDQLDFMTKQLILIQQQGLGPRLIGENGIPIEDEDVIVDNSRVPQQTPTTSSSLPPSPTPPRNPSGISPCDGIPWVEISRKFKQSSISGRLILYNKYRLPFKYDKKNQKLLGDGVGDLNPALDGAEFMIPQSKIKSISILDLDRRVYLKEGISYRIDNQNLIWIKGTTPYKNLFVTVEWYDTRTNPWTYKINEFNTQTILDTGVLNNKVNNKTYVVTQSEKVIRPEYTWFDTLERVAKYNIADPTTNGLISANPLGPWRQPLLYFINGGECHVRVEIDGKLTYLNSNGAPTTAEMIYSNTPSRINLLAEEIKQFQTGLMIDGNYAKGLFQIIEPNVETVNYAIQNDITFTAKTGIKNISVKLIDEKKYERFPASTDQELSIGLRMTLDVRKLEPVPYRDCYEGLRTEYAINEEYEIQWQRQQPCLVDPKTGEVVMQYRTTTETVVKTIIDWEGQSLNNSLPDCECLDIVVENDPIQTDVPNCGCREITTANFYTICRGGIREDIFKMYAHAADKNKRVFDMPEPPGVSPYMRDKTIKISKCKSVDFEDRDTYIYHSFAENDMIKGHIETETKGLFNSQEYVDCYSTSSFQTASLKNYYYEIVGCNDCDKSKPYFSVWYGDSNGSGSLFDSENNNKSLTKGIYTQYRLMALDESSPGFVSFNTGIIDIPNDVYVIKFNRHHFGDRLDIGNFELNLAQLSGSYFNNDVHTGSNVKVSGSNPRILSLVDNSIYVNDTYCVEDPYASYDLVSGSLDNGIHNSGTGSIITNTNLTTYGKVYPAQGLVVLNSTQLNEYLSFNTVTGSNIAGDNAFKLFTSISGAAAAGQSMKSRRIKHYGTNYYYVRLPYTEANYSNNPTALKIYEDYQLKYNCFATQPVTYLTSIGLYDDSKNLLAVAKLSSPVKKSYDDDIFIKIKLGK
jgi:hypothetical protein